MKVSQIISVFQIYLLLQNTTPVHSAKCTPTVTSTDCNTKKKIEDYWKWFTFKTYRISADVKKGCQSSTLEYSWTLTTEGGTKAIIFTMEPSFYIRPFTLTVGTYIVNGEITEISTDKQKATQPLVCTISIHPSQPIAIIAGGRVVTYPANEAAELNAGVSIDLDINPNGKIPTVFKYRWSCTAKNKVQTVFCKKHHPKKNRLLIPKEYMIHNEAIEVRVIIENKQRRRAAIRQTVLPLKGYQKVEIRCIKNCNKAGSRKPSNMLSMSLYAVSKFINAFKWEVYRQLNNELLYTSPTNSATFYLDQAQVKNFFKPGSFYRIVATIDDGISKGFAEEHIQMDFVRSGEGKCSISPLTGVSFETDFKIQCTQFRIGVQFFVYSRIEGKLGVLLAVTSSPLILIKLDHTVKKLLVLTVTESGYSPPEYLDEVNVVSRLSKFSQVGDKTKYIRRKYLQLKRLINGNLIDKAVQTVCAIVEALKELPKSLTPFRVSIGKDILTVLDKLPLQGETEYQQMSSILAKISDGAANEMDVMFQAKLSALCKKAAQFQLNQKANSRFKLIATEEVKKINVFLMRCAQTAFKTPTVVDKEVAKPENPLINEGIFKENYPNYDEMKKTDEKSQRLTSIADAIQTMHLSGQALSVTNIVNEDSNVEAPDNMDVNVKKKTVEDFNKTPIKGEGVELKMEIKPEDSQTKSIQSVITTLDKENNPFTFDETGNRIVTNIVDISIFTEDNKRLTSFKEEIEMTMEIITQYKPVTNNFSVEAPAHIKDWTPENMDYNMSVIRVAAQKGGNMILKIQPVNPIQFVGVLNRRPSFSDVQNGEVISEPYNIVINPERELSKRDFWYYIGIIPSRQYAMDNMVKNENVSSNFSVSAMTQKCSFWNWKDKQWDTSGCRIGSNNSVKQINCFCEHLSIFVGIEDDLPAVMHKIMIIDYRLELQVDYVIFGFVLACFLVFALYLACSAGRRKIQLLEEGTIFLSDNLKNERYAYLLVVETGSGSSGTSSNIGIQIFGTKQYSKPHILNYPDPEKMLLQSRSLDYFVLTSEKHLGDILSIHIWTDSIGYRQAWYCNSIRIHDIQTAAIWRFNVKKWLTVLDNGKTEYRLVPNVIEEENVFRRILLKLCPCLKPKPKVTNDETSTREVNLTFMEKACLKLSKAMMAGVVVLSCYGLPQFKISDALYFGGSRFYSKMYWTTAVGAIAPFVAHIPFDIIFRYTKWKAVSAKRKTFSKENRLLLFLWVCLIFLIIFDLTFLLACGFWVSHFEARLWLPSTLIALLFLYFTLENAYLGLKIYLGLKFEKIVEIKSEFGRIIEETEAQRRILYNKFGEMLLRPYMKYKYYPLTKRRYLSKRRREKLRQEMAQMFRELIVFSLYCVVLFYLLLVHLDNQQVLSNHETEDIVVKGDHHIKFYFDDFYSWKDVLMYVELTLLQSLHPASWYKSWNKVDAGLIIDFSSRLLGVVQMRQLKVNRAACQVPEEVKFLNLTCEPDYSYKYDGVFSKEIMAAHQSDDRFPDFWIKKSAEELNTSSTWTVLAAYPGSGYVMSFGRNAKNSDYILKYIDQYHWLDYFTRVLFISFWIYNPNHNIFNAIKLIVERSATGFFVTSYKISTARLVFTDMRKYIFTGVCFAVFLFLLIRLIAYHVVRFIKHKLAYIKNVFNFLDMVILTLSAFCLVCHILDTEYTKDLLVQLHAAKNNQFVQFDTLFKFRYYFKIFSAVLICLCVLRIWKFLRFMKMFKIMEYTLSYAFRPLTAMMFCHTLIILAYAFSGMIIFGANLDAFSSLRQAFTNLLLMTINLHKWKRFEQEMYDRLASYYYMSYMYVTRVINSLYITLLVFYYNEGQEKFMSELRDPYNLVNYLWEESKYHGELFKVRFTKERLKGGAENLLPKVTPKSAEIRYKDCEIITTSSLNQMNLIAIGKVKNMQRQKEEKEDLEPFDIELMCKIGKAICDLEIKKDKDVKIYFYPLVDSSKNIEIVLDERLEQEASVVRKILKEDLGPIQTKVDMEPVSGSFMKRLDSIDDRLDYLSKVLKNITIVNRTT